MARLWHIFSSPVATFFFQASGNRLAGRLFQTIHRAMMVTSQLVDLEHALRFHQPILVAIDQRNPELASRLMSDHLTDARDLLLHSRQQETSRQLRDHLVAGQSVHKRFRKSIVASGRGTAKSLHFLPSKGSDELLLLQIGVRPSAGPANNRELHQELTVFELWAIKI